MTEITNGIIKMKILKNFLKSYLELGWKEIKNNNQTKKK